MRNRYRSPSVASWAFWAALLVGGTLYGAYRFDWFPIAFVNSSGASDEKVATNAAAPESAPTPPGGKIEVAQNVLESQSEPAEGEIEQTSGAAPHAPGNARARLLEQRAEGLRPTQHANSATPTTVPPTNIEDIATKRPLFREGRPTGKPRTSPGTIVPISHSVVEPDSIDPQLAGHLKSIDRSLAADDILSAHRELSTLYWAQPQWRSAIQTRIRKTAQTIYFDRQTHFLDPYVIKPNDQLAQFAKRYEVPWQYLAKLNGVDPKTIRAGQKLKVIKGPFSAIVELDKFVLTVHSYGYYVKAYPIGIGKDGSSPVGKHTVVNKMVNPQYTDPQGRVVDGDDPSNPLGERWLDLGDGYGLHGTIDPGSIGKAESRGCIRMRNEDIEEVYDLLAVGSDVTIRP